MTSSPAGAGPAAPSPRPDIPRIQRIVSVLWPSFLTAGLATVLFFIAFDPEQLVASGLLPEVSRLGAYTVGFFLFWLLTAGSCLLTCYFQRPCAPPNGPGRSS